MLANACICLYLLVFACICLYLLVFTCSYLLLLAFTCIGDCIAYLVNANNCVWVGIVLLVIAC